MAWPPATLPTNRTNATPQLDTHAADHNAHALAINDLVDRLNGRGIFLEGGAMQQPGAPMVVNSNILTVYDTSHVPFVTRVFVTLMTWAAADQGPMDMHGVTLITNTGASQASVGSLAASPANRWSFNGLNTTWDVPANGNAGWNVQVGWASAVGTTFVGANLMWQRYII